MTPNPVTFVPDMEILRAIHLLVERKISGGPVIDARGNVVGMLTEQDCMRVALNACYHGELGGRVEEFMATGVKTVEADSSIVDLAELFLETSYRRFPVVERQRLVGQVSRHDVLRALEALY